MPGQSGRGQSGVGRARVGAAPPLVPRPSPAPDTRAGRRSAPVPVQVGGHRPEAYATGSVDGLLTALRRNFGRSRVVAFVNPKGGVHKTTATVLTAATLGSARNGGVLAWDDNELRGTLGLRAGTARHARTIRHLVDDLDRIETGPGILAEVLDDYLRHTKDGSFDVLAGDEDPRIARRLDPATVRRVLTLLAGTHDVICVDTGNNVESPNWQTVLRAADQLVVTTVPREDAAFTADWMLDLLEEQGMGELVAQATTVISCPTPNPLPLTADLLKHFGSRTRTSIVVPYDVSLEPGSTIEYSKLAPATRMAWLYAGVAISEGFGPDR
ncbi:hypothetical protein NUM_20990 [Actinocatenispora comari]|uniref:MinD-like ATPase involved in chromosome partitioning or flagellar assembly n=1 Tax=Actinocatenispora comari TaxID=2807577 RepID=A0A8J4EK93_9ACTN|nr:hypothetical protein NUM_20990 [Actinocatenispora comari]